MLQRFIRDSLIYSIPRLLSGAMGVVLVPIYTKYLLPNQYGVMDILNIVYTLVNFIICFEITQAVARFLADAKDKTEIKTIASTAFIFSLVAYMGYALISLGFSEALARWILDDSSFSAIYRLFIFSSVLQGLFYFTINQLRWELKSKESVIAQAIYGLLSPVLTFIGLVVFELGLSSIYYALIVSNAVALAVSFYFLRNSLGLIFDLSVLKEMFTFSAPLVPSSIGVLAAVYIDRIFLKEMMSLNEVGIYGVAYSIASVMGLLFAGVQLSLTPLVYNYYKIENTRAEVAQIFRYFILAALGLIFLLVVFSSEIMTYLIDPNYHGSQYLIPFLMFSILCSYMYIFFPGIGIAKKTKTIALINFGVALVNIVLNILLIPVWGVYGAALATAIGTGIGAFLYFYFSQKHYPIKFNWSRILPAFMLVVVLMMIVYQAQASLAIRLLIAISGVGILVVMMADFNDLKKIRAIFKKA